MESETVQAGSDVDTARPATMEEALGGDQLIEDIETNLQNDDAPVQATPLLLDELDPDADEDSAKLTALELLADIEVEVAVEFGRRRLALRELLSLQRGSLIELEREPDQHVTVLANGTEIAYGDIVLVGDRLGVHIVGLASLSAHRAQAATEPATSPEAPAIEASGTDTPNAADVEPVDPA